MGHLYQKVHINLEKFTGMVRIFGHDEDIKKAESRLDKVVEDLIHLKVDFPIQLRSQ